MATYYVATTGSNSNNGSSGSPWLTIQKAADNVVAGDTVIVRDGNYTSSATDVVAISRSGTAGNPITFRSENKWGAQIYKSSTVRTVESGFSIDGSYIVIENFIVRDIAYWAIGIGSAASNAIIRGNKIYNIGRIESDYENEGYVGVNLALCNNAIVEKNIIYNVGRLHPGENGANPQYEYWKNHDHGIYLYGATNARISYNVVYNCFSGWPMHIYYEGATVASQNCNIYNNTFAFPNAYRDGHIVFQYALNMQIKNNLFYSPTNLAVNFDTYTSHSGTISYNMAYGATVMPSSVPSGIIANNNYNSINPLIVSASTPDFHLQSGSPAINKGVDVGLTTDFDGNPIVGLPDIGAYEYATVNSLTATPQSYVLTARNAVFTTSRSLSISPQSFVLTGMDAVLDVRRASALIADKQSYVLTGIDAQFAIQRSSVLVATQQSYVLNGIDVGLSVGRNYILDATTQTYELNGNDVSLLTTGNYSMFTTPQEYLLNGVSVEFFIDRRYIPVDYSMDMGSSLFLLNGIDATLAYSMQMLNLYVGIASVSKVYLGDIEVQLSLGSTPL